MSKSVDTRCVHEHGRMRLPAGCEKCRLDERDYLVGQLKYAVGRIAWHHPSCRGGLLAKCRCLNATTVRNLEKTIKKYDPEYQTEIEYQEAAAKSRAVKQADLAERLEARRSARTEGGET